MSIFDFFRKSSHEKTDDKNEILHLSENDKIEDEDEITAVISAVLSTMEEEETVAAITAAISVILGKNTSEFVVRNIRRTTELDPIWAQIGRIKLMKML
jgi:DhnA family fructose-bisphosphate aldolase class Ia